MTRFTIPRGPPGVFGWKWWEKGVTLTTTPRDVKEWDDEKHVCDRNRGSVLTTERTVQEDEKVLVG